jgi:hypothetical protein
MKTTQALWLLGASLLVMTLNILASILFMVAYSYVINPGHEAAFYQEYAQKAVPYSAIIAGFPLMFLMAARVSKWWNGELGIKAPLTVWLIYFLVDLVVVATAGASITTLLATLTVVSQMTKLLAAYLGWLFSQRRA